MTDITAEVTMRTGKSAPGIVINTTFIALKFLMAPPEETGDTDYRDPGEHLRDALVGYELAVAARDRTHVMWGETGKRAVALGLATAVKEDGTIELHEIVRDIIEASTVLADHDVSLRHPVAQRGEAT